MKIATAKTRPLNRLKATPAKPKQVMRIQSILVPVDFSQPSLKALVYAAALAEQFDAKLTLLYVNEPTGMLDFAQGFPLMIDNDTLNVTCKARLADLAGKHSIEPAMVEKTLIRQGRPHHEITEAARTLKVDMIVISTHGYTGVTHAVLGSVTERVVRHAPCPVLVVREQEHDFVSKTK
jgi:universal stress protein A